MEGDQFSLCWNNFHNNLSSGFHSLLQDEDLVDVTIAAGGKYLKAHKTVLSVCSPYFKELFRANPCKHPIVILPDINYENMKNLLQFMYQGEVSVSQEQIPTFMRVAEALKVKGLTDADNETNGLENRYSTSSSAKRKAPVKKLIKPKHNLRPIESPPSPLPQPPLKQIKMEDPLRLDTPEPKKDVSYMQPKSEPLDEDEDDFMDNQLEEHSLDASTMLVDTTFGEPSSTNGRLKYERKSHVRSESPGTLQCIIGKRGNPRLIVDGHSFFKKSTYKLKSFWYCKQSRGHSRCPAVCWTVNGQIVKWPNKHTHPVHYEMFNPEEETLIPIDKIQEVLLKVDQS